MASGCGREISKRYRLRHHTELEHGICITLRMIQERRVTLPKGSLKQLKSYKRHGTVTQLTLALFQVSKMQAKHLKSAKIRRNSL